MYKCITTSSELKHYLNHSKIIAFDFETAPNEMYITDEKAALDPHKSHIVGISFSVTNDSAVYLSLTHYTGTNANNQDEIWKYLKDKIFTNPQIIKVAHNLSFESMFLYKLNIILQPPVYDTIAAAQLTLKNHTSFRSLGDSGLKTLVPTLYNIELPTFESVTNGRSFAELDPQDYATIRYACADSDYTLRLYHTFNQWFDTYLPNHRYITEEIESPTAVYVGIMKYNGLLADKGLMTEKQAKAVAQIKNIRDDILTIIGDVNIGANASTISFKKYLYEDLRLPVVKRTDMNQASIDDEALILLREYCQTHRPELVKLFDLVQDYRRWNKIKSTYIDGYLKYINNATNHIHADLMPLATDTGRFACRNPNLQNIPRSGSDEIGIRNFFIAHDGNVLLSLDFSQIELRVGAFYCRDEKMLETYRNNGDIHDQTATVIYGEGKHDKEQRTIAKNVNFGTFFGLFPKGLQNTLKFKAGLDTSLAECEAIIENLKRGYPKLTEWQEETKSQASVKRYSETWLGRRRYLPDISSSDWGKRSYAERCALNTPIQGTAADILKLALGQIIQGLPSRPWLKPLLQIHDELVFELPSDKVSEAVTFIKQCMETQPFPEFDIPIIAEASVGTQFGDMTEI